MLIIWNASDGSFFPLDESCQVIAVPNDVTNDELEEALGEGEHRWGWWSLQSICADAGVMEEQ